MIFFKRISLNHGFSIVEALVAAAILLIASSGLTTIILNNRNSNKQLGYVRDAYYLKSLYTSTILSPGAWKKTVALNAGAMNCLDKSKNTPCAAPPAGGHSFVLYDADGVQVPGHPPLGYQLKWSPICDSYPCADPVVQISGQFQNGDILSKAILNTNNYEISLNKGETSNTFENNCLAMKGIYNPVDLSCRPNFAGQPACPPKQFIKSIAPDGTVTCAYPFSGLCGVNEVLVGVAADGTAQCGPKICDCHFTEAWSPCTALCGGGTETSTITIIGPALGGGAACPVSQTLACNTEACCAPNMGSACTGTQHQEWNDVVPGCAGACSTCDYAVNKCTAAGAVSCTDPVPPAQLGPARCWAEFEASGFVDCSGTCQIGGCGEFTGCRGRNWIYQGTDCKVSVLTYRSPACP